MSKFKVGDTVIYVPGRALRAPEPEERSIAKVGRKYVYLEWRGQWWMERKGFSIETGRENVDGNYPDYIYTPAEWAEEQRRSVVLRQLRERHRHTLNDISRLPVDTLEKLLALLEEAKQ